MIKKIFVTKLKVFFYIVLCLKTVLEKKMHLISDQLQFFFPILCIDQLQLFQLKVKKTAADQRFFTFQLYLF